MLKFSRNQIICLVLLLTIIANFAFSNFSFAGPVPKCANPLWLWPVQPKIIVKDYDPPEQKWLAGHRGVDLLSSEAGIILAPDNGIISFSGIVALKPVVTVKINGLKSTFEPAATILPIGTPVSRGMPIAKVISPDTYINHCEPAICLHWGIKNEEDIYFDPKDYADAKGPIVVLEIR
ncbi:MAG: hypothetical protein LBT85_04085 [Bifidobacteriaceae bacterium]|nr:hypothetical protein [Bifidobacteriaceae bacterium]